MRYFIGFLFLLLAMHSSGQETCSGNLGDNIFLRGDFGSGTDPVLNTDPNIAPGYIYTQGVPNDGQYSIANNTGALPGLYPTWLVTEDSSDDPNGYMMVVNASFEPGIFYEEVVSGLCENTLYEFSADIVNLILPGTSNHSDPNLDFLIDDVVVYSTGNIPKTGRWQKYGFTFVATSVQTSIKLTLRNNAPGGIGNDLALDNISFRPCGPASFIGIEGGQTIFLCRDDEPVSIFAEIDGADGQVYSIQWQRSQDGLIWEDIAGSNSNSILHSEFIPDTYYYRYYSAGNEVNLLNEKCRVISDIIIVEVLPEVYNLQDTICEGLNYEFGNQTLTQSGSYESTFISSFGCDSLVELELYVAPSLPIQGDFTLADPTCFGFNDGVLMVDSIYGGYGNYEVNILDSSNASITANFSSGIYTIEYEDKFGCRDSEDIILTDPPEITVSLDGDTTIRLGDEVFLSPIYSENGLSLSWTGNGVFDCTNCDDVLYLPYQNSNVSITAMNENGCLARDSVQVNLDGEPLVYLPNIFSPNDDRINDGFTFNFYGRSVLQIKQFVVYDRWGNKMYEILDVQPVSGDIIWDGTSKNTICSAGVYSYVIDVEFINGDRLRDVGMLTLLR